MAGRYVLTPARRAALKRAQAKSAAKRKGRKSYRAANRQSARKINSDYRNGKYGGVGNQLLTGRPRRKAQHAYDRAKNDNAVKYKGKKRRSDRYLKNKRRAKTVAATGAYLAVVNAPAIASAVSKRNSEYAKASRAHTKANKKRYNTDKKASLKRRQQNFKAAGLNKHGGLGGSRRKPHKVTSHRLPGQAMIGSKR